MMKYITATELKEMVKGDHEFALLDVRERNPFSKEHLLLSSCIPLSQLELIIGYTVPRLSTRIVVINESPSDVYHLDKKAAERLVKLGYTDVSILKNGISGWREAGFELFSGVGSYSKAFGEWIAEQYHTPFLTAQEAHKKIESQEKKIILDCRPKNEYYRMTIPGSINAPGVELVYRVHEAVPDPNTLILVHCAGRTRSIIGTQSLVNAGIPNPVVAIENGTMGWQLAGFELEYGQTRSASLPSHKGFAEAKKDAERLAERYGIRKISHETLKNWMSAGSSERNLYVLDVRLPEEYETGHIEGSRNIQGGQLVQAADLYIPVFNSQVVLLDDTEVRAIMTASWLIQEGWSDVYVVENGITTLPLTMGPNKPHILGFDKSDTLTPKELEKLLQKYKNEVGIVDLAVSTYYKEKHIPGAWWAIRSRLEIDVSKLPNIETMILTSEDGVLAHFAANDLKVSGFKHKVLVLEGGTKAWIDAGQPTSNGMERAISESDDTWFQPYMDPNAPDEAKRAYFEWEYGLVAQVERDGTAKYRMFPDK